MFNWKLKHQEIAQQVPEKHYYPASPGRRLRWLCKFGEVHPSKVLNSMNSFLLGEDPQEPTDICADVILAVTSNPDYDHSYFRGGLPSGCDAEPPGEPLKVEILRVKNNQQVSQEILMCSP